MKVLARAVCSPDSSAGEGPVSELIMLLAGFSSSRTAGSRASVPLLAGGCPPFLDPGACP